MLGAPPFTVGWELSGVVAATGAGVTRFAVGDEVSGMPRFPAEAAVWRFALKPPNLSHEQAGGLALAERRAGPHHGKPVLVPQLDTA